MKFLVPVVSLLSLFVTTASRADAAGSPDAPSRGVALDNVVVTANRIPTDRARVGTATYVMTAEEIELRQYRFVLDALRGIPGVTISQNGGLGGFASARIRGAASAQTLVRIDGVVVNDPTSPAGGFDFANLDTSDVETIEVYGGPQSTMYGSDAMGGVVNIVTRSVASASSLSGYAEGGSYGTRRFQVESGGRLNRFGYRVSANHVKADGFSRADEADGNVENDAYESLTLSGRLSADFSERLSLLLTGRYLDTESGIDNFGGPGGDALGLLSEMQQTSAGAALNAEGFGGRLDQTLTLRYLETETAIDAFSFATQGEQSTVEYQGVYEFANDYRMLFGAEYEEQSVADPNGFAPKREIDSTGLFAMLQFAPIDGLDLTAGVRRDDYETGGAAAREDFAARNTVQLTGAWRVPNADTIIRASWGQGFRAPTIFQLSAVFPPATEPNTNLRSETGDGWDIGMEHRFGLWDLNVQLTYFRIETNNLIKFGNGRYENIDSTRRKGLEFTMQAALT
ncbi:MAG: TonB-dependent receptor plug domain-containing protein, partial [Gammaproteobacteria bacterium]